MTKFNNATKISRQNVFNGYTQSFELGPIDCLLILKIWALRNVTQTQIMLSHLIFNLINNHQTFVVILVLYQTQS